MCDPRDPQVINLGIRKLADDLSDDGSDDDAPYRGEHSRKLGLQRPGGVGREPDSKGKQACHQQVDDGSGDEFWNSLTESNQLVVSGIYIVHFEATTDVFDPETGELTISKGESTHRKLIVIR